MKQNRKIMIDCDPGTDDALAILLASVHLRERLLCFVSSYGNSSLRNTHGNLLGLTALLGMEDVPVLRGCSRPMERESFVPTDYHGENGLCGIVLSRDDVLSDGEDELDRVYEMLKGEKDAVYVALGPLTNLALLLRRYPDAADCIGEAVIMGGGFSVSNTECGAEYNFSLDPAAVRLVIKADMKKKLAALDLTHTLAFSEAEIETMVGTARDGLSFDDNSPHGVLGRIFFANLDSALRDGHEGAIIHDGAAVASLCDGCGFSVRRERILSDEAGRLFVSEQGQTADVVCDMSKSDLLDLMKKAFDVWRQILGDN